MCVSSSPGQRGAGGAGGGVEPSLRSSPVVLFSLVYAVIRLVLQALIVRGRATGELRAQVLAFRHQLQVLERQAGRPGWQPYDRLLLVAISRILTRPAWRSLLCPAPETLVHWHRELVHHNGPPTGDDRAAIGQFQAASSTNSSSTWLARTQGEAIAAFRASSSSSATAAPT